MKKIILILAFIITHSNLFSADSTHSYHSLFELGKFIGTWKMETEGKIIFEKWNNVSNETLEGSSVLVVQTKSGFDTLSIENLRLVSMEGEVFYIAKPDENPFPTPFKLISSLNNTYVFENKSHNFPTKIIYKFKDDDNIDIEVSNTTRKIYLYYKRVK